MKQFLHSFAITLCIALMATGAQAQVITAERAQEIANSFFQNGKQKSAAVRSTAAVSMKKSADSRILSSESSSDAPTFHILTPASGEGFVIVSGEEMENPIIGYSFEGTIDTNDLPVGFTDYMTDIDAQVKALRKYNAANPQKAAAARSAMKKAMQKTNYAATTMGNIVVQIETAKWGQNTPFNDQCWTSAEQTVHAKTGCVPTAFAIIARHHQWPLEGLGSLYNQQTGVLFSNRTYDYSKMPLVYDGNWSSEQINEVAKLMSHLGHAFMVTWGSGETSISIGNTISENLQKFFNYNYVSVSNQYNNGTMYDFDTWKSNLKNSLDNNCPVPYSAKNSGTGDSRHMFVVDGYTDNDYFHFNFGWNGGSNGWFTLKAITPSQGDNYSWDDSEEGANSVHQAFFNLTPNKTKYTVNASVLPANAGTVSINGDAATGEYLEGATVTLAATTNTGYTFSHWSKGTETISTSKSCQVKVASSDNDYVANFLTVGNTTVNISVEYNRSYGTVTSTSGTVASGTTLTPYLNEEVTLTAEPVTGYVFSGWTVTKGTESTNYSGTSLTFVATGEMSVTANFALAVQDYVVNPTTGTLNNGTNRSSVWTFTTVGDFTAALSISATDSNGNVVNSITNKTSGTAGHYFASSGIIANTETPSSSPTIYTISVPNGYKITGYAITYYPENGSITLTNELGHNETATSSSSDYYLNASGLNVQSTTYTVAGTGRMTTLSFTVTVMKDDGAGSGSTPTQYTITATADPGTAGSVTGGGTYNEGATVTLTATPNSGYEFVNWTKDGAQVSTSATYSFTANATAEYVAHFQTAAATTFAVTTAANPTEGGTATFAEGTGQATASASVASGTEITLYAEANDGYRFVNWTKGTTEVSTVATHNVTITEASDFVANFEREAAATEYPAITGSTAENRYLTSATSTGADTNINYTANAHPGSVLVEVPGTIQVEAGVTFTLNLIAKSLGAGSTSFSEDDIRYCHTSLFTDFDRNFTFEKSPVQTWGVLKPSETNPYTGGSSHIYGNYDLVMNIAANVTVPDDAPLGTSRVRVIYTDAWGDWPTNGTSAVSSGIVYDFTVEVVEKVDITANASEGGTVTINGEATNTKRVIKGSEVALAANANDGYNFTGWYNGETLISNENPYTFTATASGTYEARFEEEATIPAVDLSGKWFRLNSNNRYMHVKGHTQSENNATCGSVNVVTSKTVNSNDEVFLFEKSGDGYKLKTRDGYYITCAEWNVDAYSTDEANGSVLLFEEDGEIYRIKWYNTFKNPDAWLYFKVGPDSQGAGDHPYGDAEYTAAATWVLEEVTLHDVTVTAAGTNGSTAVAVATGTATDKVEHGTSVTLTANANDGYNFTGWYNGEDLVTDANPYTFVLEGNISYEARFEVAAPVTYTISVSADPGTAGTASIGTETSTTVTAGEQVTLTAVPNSGYNFAGWYKDETKVSDATSYTFVPTESANYVARFEEEAAVGGGNETMHNIVTNNTTGIVSETSGTLSKIWTYSGSPEITITSSDYTISNRDAAINLRAANYTITAPEGFEIVSYTINFQTSYEATITAGTTSESYTTANSLTFNAENINAESATFSISMAAGRNIQVTSIDMVLRATGYVISVVSGEGGNAYVGATGTETETAITAGENVTLRAEVTEGYEFDAWYDSNGKFISDEAICTITPNDNMTYTAKFYALVEANKYYKLQCQGSNKYYLSSNINSTDYNRLMMNGANRIFYYGTLINEFDEIDNSIEANQKKLLAYTEGNFVGIKKRNTGDYYDVTLLDNRNEISHNVKFNAGTNGNVMISVEYVEYVDENEISTYFYLDGNGTSVSSNTNYINDNSHNWKCEEVTSLPVAISSAQHATLYAPVALEIPDGVRAYVLDASEIDATSKDIVLTRLSSIIPANTGVILKGNEGTYDFNITESTDDADTEAAKGNALAGTVARTRVVGDAYILAVREGKVGLYPLAGNSYINPDIQTASFTNGSHKAYLPVKGDALGEILKKSTGVRFIYSDEIVTGIQDGILYDGAEGESIYDLQGRKLSEITEPGIYIVNGKKRFIK